MGGTFATEDTRQLMAQVVFLRNRGVALPAIAGKLGITRKKAIDAFSRARKEQERADPQSLVVLGLSGKAAHVVAAALKREILLTEKRAPVSADSVEIPWLEEMPAIEGVEIPDLPMLKRFMGRHPRDWEQLLAEHCGERILDEIRDFVKCNVAAKAV